MTILRIVQTEADRFHAFAHLDGAIYHKTFKTGQLARDYLMSLTRNLTGLVFSDLTGGSHA